MTPSGTQPVSAAPVPAQTTIPSSRKFKIDQRYIAPLFITCILFAAQINFGVLEGYDKTMLAIAASVLTEIILGKSITGKIPHLASAYISGISVGILLRSPEYWPYALCAMISITPKYVIRVKGRHIWNPSNFAIAVMLIIAHEHVATLGQQWDNRFWAMILIWAVGSLIIWNLKRFHICATYVLAFFVFAFERALFMPDSTPLWNRFVVEIAPITGPMYQLFIFFMITDPKTTVTGRRAQMFVVFLVAFAEHVLRLNGNIHAPYYALFVVGPVANLIEIWWTSRRQNSQPVDKQGEEQTTREPALSTA